MQSRLLLKKRNTKRDCHTTNTKPRIETRTKVKHLTPYAKPQMCIAGKNGTKIKLRFEFKDGRSRK
jgi:hypothetical protein